jgi:hypothetical protein
MSGIFSLRPPIRFCRFISINWYLLPTIHRQHLSHLRPPKTCEWPLASLSVRIVENLRDHFLEASQGRFDVFSGCDVVLDLIDERGVGDAPRIGGRSIFTVQSQRLRGNRDMQLLCALTLTPPPCLVSPCCWYGPVENRARYGKLLLGEHRWVLRQGDISSVGD